MSCPAARQNRELEDEVDGVSSRGKKADELNRYINMELEKTTLDSNPLSFWKQQQNKFPHSIAATSASVERQFSGAGLVIQERRTSLNPEQLDNILLIRSMKKDELVQ